MHFKQKQASMALGGLKDPSMPAVSPMMALLVFFLFSFSTQATLIWDETFLVNTDIYAIVAVSETTLYAGTFTGGVFRTDDGGDSWVLLGLTGKPIVSMVATSPLTLYAGTNREGIFYSQDGGVSWSSLNDGLPGNQVQSLSVVNGVVYASVREHTTGHIHLFRLNGNLWELTGLVHFNAADVIEFNNALYAGGEGGVRRSTDGGNTWIEVNNNVGPNALAVWNGTLYAGTSDHVWRLNPDDTWSKLYQGLLTATIGDLIVWQKTLYAANDGGGVASLSVGSDIWTPENTALTAHRGALLTLAATSTALYVGVGAGSVLRAQLEPIPEPSTLVLLGIGLLGIMGLSKRRRQK